jgi:hypothetical protein
MIIAGNGVYFICYVAFNFGAHFQDGHATDTESTFIGNIKSKDSNDPMNPFLKWLLAIIYVLKVWVTHFLDTPAMGLTESPFLAKVGRTCKRQIQKKTHPPRQHNTWICSIYSLLNT